MKKIFKTILAVVIAIVTIVATTNTVNAVEDSIQLGTATKTEAYIDGLSFHHKKTTSGESLYCLNYHKYRASDVKANLVKDSKNITGGLIYIMKNGYPQKKITGDNAKDYYITQTAVWWYLDMVSGSSNLTNSFKTNGSDPYGLRSYVKKLADEGYSHRNDSTTITPTKLDLGSSSKEMILKDGYYVSNDIKATTQNITSYTVSLENAPKGTVVEVNGKDNPYKNSFSVNAKDSFKVKVPATSVTDTKVSLKITANANGIDQYTAYEYQPVDASMQNVARLVKTTTKASATMGLEISSSLVSITKVDSVTKKEVAGAKLVLKDSTGKVITSWTTTTNAHIIRNLANGEYTVEEVEAPKGYLLNKKAAKFTVSDKNRNIKVTFENAPKEVVVNITKIDQETNKALAGAVLLVKDSSGKEIARFTTTEESYVLTNIPNGTYTVEEVSAPEGYIKSNDVIKFTIDDDHLSHQIVFKNAKPTPVPDTASNSSIIFIILGIAITTMGIGYIYKHANQN